MSAPPSQVFVVPFPRYLSLFFSTLIFFVSLILCPSLSLSACYPVISTSSLSSSVFKKLISLPIVSRHSNWNWLAAFQTLLNTRTHTSTHTSLVFYQKSSRCRTSTVVFWDDSPRCVCVWYYTVFYNDLLDAEGCSLGGFLKQRNDEAPSVLQLSQTIRRVTGKTARQQADRRPQAMMTQTNIPSWFDSFRTR